MQPPILGEFTCPHQDGDFKLQVVDLVSCATGMCLISQVGQGQKHDIALSKAEAGRLADILQRFADS